MWPMQEQTDCRDKYGQLVTTLFNRTVNSSNEFRLWRVDWHPFRLSEDVEPAILNCAGKASEANGRVWVWS